MSNHTATTLAYVRTSAGVVRVDPDGVLPDDVDAAELQRLVDAGTVVEVDTPAPAPDPTPVPTPPTGGDKGGTRKGGKAS